MVEGELRALQQQRDEPGNVVEMSVLATALRVDRFANWR